MTRHLPRPAKVGASLLAVLMSLAAAAAQAPARPASAGLKIVVIAGEDGVNIVQTRTAVAPVVEVRDRNDVPVSGAIVRFAIQSGRASFANSARTIAVATDFSGRAAATALTPTGTGAVQIGVTATFQGQTAVATISQMNFATATQAASASSPAGSGGAVGSTAGTGGAGAAAGTATGTAAAGGIGTAAGAGAGAGVGTGAAGAGTATAAAAAGGAATAGGISATTIGIIGAAAGGGALAASKAAGSGQEKETSLAVGPTRYVGPFSGQFVTNFASQAPAPVAPCSATDAISGTVDMTISVSASGDVSGTAAFGLTSRLVSTTCANAQFVDDAFGLGDLVVAGPTTRLGFIYVDSGTGVVSHRSVLSFTGSLVSGVITGTFSMEYTETGQQGNTVREGRGNQTFPVTLTRP